MSRRKSVPAVASIDRSHIVEETERAGELVRILGDMGTVISGIYRVRCHAMNTKTETEWVEMQEVGGSKEFRAVRPERTRPATKAELRNRGMSSE
jgi:hypothetical protein